MISWLEISNFQTHEFLRIDLDPHLTTIVGPSDIGKSAVIRALRWLCTNKPDGHAFIRTGTDRAVVKLKADGRTIKRIRSKSENRYRLDGEDLKAFGTSVPTPVADLLKLGEINFLGQHDPPFWFSESAGFVSKQLNSIINLSSIDNALGRLNSLIRENGVTISVCKDRLAKAKAERNSAVVAEEMDADLKGLERKNREIDENRMAATGMRRLLEGVETYRLGRDNAGKAAMAGESVGILASRWVELRSEADQLQKLVRKAVVLGGDIERAQQAADGGESELVKLMGVKCPLCKQPIKK